MSSAKISRELVVNLVNELSGTRKERSAIEKFVSDEGLIQHFLFFERIFPNNELLIDELTVDGNRAVLRSRMRGVHGGALDEIKPTHRKIECAIVFGFEIEKSKIVRHWIIADQAELLEQLRMI